MSSGEPGHTESSAVQERSIFLSPDQGVDPVRFDRYKGAVIGAVVGESLGEHVRDVTWPDIKRKFGDKGVADIRHDAVGRTTDGALTLSVLLDAAVRADRTRREVSNESAPVELAEVIRRWVSRDPVRGLGGRIPSVVAPDFTSSVVSDSFRSRLSGGLGNPRDALLTGVVLGSWSPHPRETIGFIESSFGEMFDESERAAAATVALMIQQNILTGNFARAFGQPEVSFRNPTQVQGRILGVINKGWSLGQRGISPVRVESLGDGRTVDSAIAIAVCAVQAAETDFDEAIRIAVSHSGDSSLTGALAGALMGSAFDGITMIPEHWSSLLVNGKTVFRAVNDACDQFGGKIQNSQEWSARYPMVSASGDDVENRRRTPVPAETGRAVDPQSEAPVESPPAPTPGERFVGAMLAGAVGDALGYAIEFSDVHSIRRHHGELGLTEPVLRDGVAEISDDTQMMLFTLEGMIRAHVARRLRPVDSDPVPEVQHAYQRWFHTQRQPWERAGGPYARQLPRPDGWLITNEGLFRTRAPGATCMSALANFAQTHQHATPGRKINDSKGCGGVMRAAPVAVWSNDPAEVFHASVGTAALTHSHSSGFLSAGVLAVIVHQLLREVSLEDSVRMARDLLVRWPGHQEQVQRLDAAVELSRRGKVEPEELTEALGQGWVGEEALAIGLYAAMATDSMREALLMSVNHSGDSDSTGIVCGNIVGAMYGERAIPQEWLRDLELRDVIRTLAQDALVEFSPGPPTNPGWSQRYPAW